MFKNRRVNFEYWIVCNQSFQRAIRLWVNQLPSQGLFILSSADSEVNIFCEVFINFLSDVFCRICDDSCLRIPSQALDYSTISDQQNASKFVNLFSHWTISSADCYIIHFPKELFNPNDSFIPIFLMLRRFSLSYLMPLRHIKVEFISEISITQFEGKVCTGVRLWI